MGSALCDAGQWVGDTVSSGVDAVSSGVDAVGSAVGSAVSSLYGERRRLLAQTNQNMTPSQIAALRAQLPARLLNRNCTDQPQTSLSLFAAANSIPQVQ